MCIFNRRELTSKSKRRLGRTATPLTQMGKKRLTRTTTKKGSVRSMWYLFFRFQPKKIVSWHSYLESKRAEDKLEPGQPIPGLEGYKGGQFLSLENANDKIVNEAAL